jgi:DNA-binding transcriptional ArsR family regulator
MPGDDLDGVWKALSDNTRRSILDLLREGSHTTTQIVEAFPHLSRFGVMKHIEVLREAGLIHTREERRQRINSLNVVPIRQIYERWVGRFEELWASHLLRLKEDAEAKAGEARAAQAGKEPATRSRTTGKLPALLPRPPALQQTNKRPKKG